MTLLRDPAAKLIGMKVRVFSDSTVRVGVPNPDISNNWATSLDEAWNEQGFDEELNMAAREVQFIWHGYPGAHTIDIEKHIRTYLNGRNPESPEDRIIISPMFSDIDWTKKGCTEICLHNAKEVAAFAAKFTPGHWCFLGPASEKTWWNGNPNKLPRTMGTMEHRKVLASSSHFTSKISSDSTIIAWALEQ